MTDAEIIKIVIEQNNILKKDIKELISAQGTAIRGKMEMEVDRIHEMDLKRNGRIEKNECDVKEVKRDTKVTRWAHRNPKVAIIAFVIIMFGLMTAFHTIELKRTISKMMKIEFKEN